MIKIPRVLIWCRIGAKRYFELGTFRKHSTDRPTEQRHATWTLRIASRPVEVTYDRRTRPPARPTNVTPRGKHTSGKLLRGPEVRPARHDALADFLPAPSLLGPIAVIRIVRVEKARSLLNFRYYQATFNTVVVSRTPHN